MPEEPIIIKHKGDPPELILSAWTQTEIGSGEILTREEQALIAALTMTIYITNVATTPERIEAIRQSVGTILEKVNAPPCTIPIFTKEILQTIMKK